MTAENGPSGVMGVFVAVLLHAGIIAATLYTFAHTKFEIADESPPVVPVDLVTIGPKTNLMATVKEQPRIAKEEIETKLDTRVTEQIPKLEQAEPAPDEAASEPVIKKPTPAPVPKIKPQQQPPDTKPKATADAFNALLNKYSAPSATPRNARLASRTSPGFGAQTAMTEDLVDALRSMIRPCWSPPVGAPHAEELIVAFDVYLNPDGTVARKPQLLADYSTSDPYTRAAAEAAERAIMECQPYKLPQDRYAQWREIDRFRFDPRQMMDQ